MTTNTHKNSRIVTLAIFSISYFLFSVTVVFAAQLKIATPSLTGDAVTVGSEINLDVLLNSDEGLNAIEGSLLVNSPLIEIKDVNDGNSIISLWIDGPKLESGKIIFAGAVPGGFVGQNGKLFSVKVLFKSAGSAKISFSNLKGFMNDGEGTPLSLSGSARTFRILNTGEATTDMTDDQVSPEDFTPIIGKDDQIFGGQYFVTFTTNDKGSGIDYYEVAEKKGIFKPGNLEWQETASPHLLADQGLDSWIFVKAVDKQGNERIAFIQPEISKSRQRLLTTTVGVVAIMLLLVVWWRFRSRKKR